MATGGLLLTIGFVWGVIAVVLGIVAEVEGRSPWGWFIGGLLFGVFALFVYWATDSPDPDERTEQPLSFIVSLKYGFVLVIGAFLSALLANFFMEALAPIPTGVNFAAESYTGPSTDQMRQVRIAVRGAVMAPLLMMTALGYLSVRYRDVEHRRDISTHEAWSVGALAFSFGVWSLLAITGNAGASYSTTQLWVIVAGGLLTTVLLSLCVWVIGLGRSVANKPFPTS